MGKCGCTRDLLNNLLSGKIKRDTVTYVVDTTDDSLTVQASLLYQPVSYPFLVSERESSDPTVSRFLEAYEQVNKTTVVDEETKSVGS